MGLQKKKIVTKKIERKKFFEPKTREEIKYLWDNEEEVPMQRKIDQDEFADLMCSGQMRLIRECDVDLFERYRVYKKGKGFFIYRPKIVESESQTSWPAGGDSDDEEKVSSAENDYINILEKMLKKQELEIEQKRKGETEAKSNFFSLMHKYNIKCENNRRHDSLLI